MGQREKSLMLVGLDGAGKSTILKKLRLDVPMRPSNVGGFNIKTVIFKKITFRTFDLGGQDIGSSELSSSIRDTRGIVFVVDSTDRMRIGEARDTVQRMMSGGKFREAAVLVFANKQDLPNAMGADEITESLRLNDLRTVGWHVQPSSATSGDGLYEGINWLASVLRGNTSL